METRYFVKFVGEKHVTVAKARTAQEVETLLTNQYEETTESFFNWIRDNTTQIAVH